MLLFTGVWVPTLPADMRAALQGLLDAGLLAAPVVEDLQLVVTELLTNAARAGAGIVSVSVGGAAGRAVLEVTDDAAGLPVQRHSSPDDVTGRGLEIVSAIAEEWGCRDNGGITKTVWARLAS